MLAGGHPLGAAQLRGGNARLLTLRLRRVTASRVACSAASTPLRPYTLRKGDTLESIASKRGLTIAEMQSYNKDLMSPGATVFVCSTVSLSHAPRCRSDGAW